MPGAGDGKFEVVRDAVQNKLVLMMMSLLYREFTEVALFLGVLACLKTIIAHANP